MGCFWGIVMFLLGRNSGRKLAAAGAALVALTGSALADGYGGSIKDAPVEEGRKFSWSITLGGTSDYIFRGISQTFEDPAAAGLASISATASSMPASGPQTSTSASALDPRQKPRSITMSASSRPGARSRSISAPSTTPIPMPASSETSTAARTPLDYFELKAGYSMASPWIKNLTTRHHSLLVAGLFV